jgi:hypothetical protein
MYKSDRIASVTHSALKELKMRNSAVVRNLTNLQLVAFATLHAMFEGELKLFQGGGNQEWGKANTERCKLWKFLEENFQAKERQIEKAVAHCEEVVKYHDKIEMNTTSVVFNIILRSSRDRTTVEKETPYVTINIRMNLTARFDIWHVKEVIFLPLSTNQSNFYHGQQTTYVIT